MKKLVIAAALMGAVGAASAVEVGLAGGSDLTGVNLGTGRLSVGVPVTVPLLGRVTGAFEYSYAADQDNKAYDQYALTLTKDVVKVGPVTVAARGGVAHLDQVTAPSGTAFLVGAAAGFNVTKAVRLEATVDQRYGLNGVAGADSTIVMAGVKFSF